MSKKKFIFGVLCLLVFFCPQTTQAAKLFEITDDSGHAWQNGQTVAIFGEGSPALLYPYKNGSYTFQIKNVTDSPQDYWLQIEEQNVEEIPLTYRLKEDERFIFGAKSFEFLPAGSFKRAEHLPARQVKTYRLEWQWDGAENDARDTALGKKAAEKDLMYNLKLKVISEAADRPITPLPEETQNNPATPNSTQNFLAQNGPQEASIKEAKPADDKVLGFLPKTGEARHYWIIYTGVLLVLLSFLLKQQKGNRSNE